MAIVSHKEDSVWKGALLLGCVILLLGAPLRLLTPLEIMGGDRKEIQQKTIRIEVLGSSDLEGIYELPEGTNIGAFLRTLGKNPEDEVYQEGLSGQPLDDFAALNLKSEPEGSSVHVTSMTQGKIFLLGGRLDLNRAGVWDLMLLPGVGPVLARRIVEDRQTNGPFHTPQDLIRVSGISFKTLKKFESMVTVTAEVHEND